MTSEGKLSIIPVKIHNKVDGNKTIEGLRYSIQFEAEKEDVLTNQQLNEIRIAAKTRGLKEGCYNFKYVEGKVEFTGTTDSI